MAYVAKQILFTFAAHFLCDGLVMVCMLARLVTMAISNIYSRLDVGDWHLAPDWGLCEPIGDFTNRLTLTPPRTTFATHHFLCIPGTD
jgi:hypothetical protein